jgi:chromosome segregation protein
MQLKSLELTGFKSFPDKTLINFSSGITAIVGPNGSGKSNIADAIRWVMGETSSRTLRGVKMEDVIFDGTQSRRPLGFAEVSLTLDNSDGALPEAYSEVVISRRYYRSGESEYFINRQNVRLKDIHDLFRDTGLGRTGYSIIGQGSVTEIISAKSTDRRTVFEEAAGIAKYRFKKEESERKLAATQDNIVRLSDIIAELSDRLGPLEQQAKKARKYIELFDEKKKLEISLWLSDLARFTQELAEIEKTEAALNESTEKNDAEILRCENKMEQLADDIAMLTAKIEQMRTESKQFDELVQQKNSEILLINNDIEHSQKDIERINAEILNAGRSDEEIIKEVEDQSAKAEELKKETEKIDEEISDICEERETRLGDDKNYAENSGRLNGEYAALSSEITSLRVSEARASEKAQSLSDSNESLQKELDDAKERLESLKKGKESGRQRLEELEKTLEDNKNIFNGYSMKVAGAKKKLETVNSEYNTLKFGVSEKKSRKAMFEDMEKHYEGFSGSVKSVMNEASRGVLSGVHGTVASVIKVDPEYATATEIALGAAIQNIITENERSAKDCIYYLKSKNLGRATFLPLSTITGRKLDPSSLRGARGYRGIASDLIEYGEKYKGIIEQLLGRTVIVETIDDATDIARANKYSFKVVTLDGQVVNPGGSLTGGSVGKNTGILSRTNEIKKLETEIAGLEEQLKEKEQKLKAITSDLASAQAALDGLVAENQAVSDEHIRIKAEVEHSEQYIFNISEQIRTFENSISGNTAEKESTIAELEEIKAELETKLLLIDEKQKEISDLDEKHEALAKIQEEISSRLHEKDMQKLEKMKDIENIADIIKRLEERRKEGEALAAKLKNDIDSILSDIEKFRKTALEKTEDLARVRFEAEEKAAAIAAENEKRTAVEAEKNSLFEEEKKYFANKDRLGREAERITIKKTSLKTEIDSVSSKIWDEYEMTMTDAEQFAKDNVPDDIDSARKRVSELKGQIKALGSVNVEAIEEFAQVKQRHDSLEQQTNDLISSKESLEKIIEQLVKEMTVIFETEFKKINEAFVQVFRELFGGGTAKLTLTEPDDPLGSGVDIYVAPPGKVIKHLSSLSGGEQSLTAIALYFALMKVRPSPFCLLDEIESALDDVNVTRYAQYLRGFADTTQFLLITHRRGSMEAADRLYGVTMREKGISKILTIDITEAAENDE